MPPGTEHGAQWQLDGEGNWEPGRGVRGPLTVRLVVIPHPTLELEGGRLRTTIQVDFAKLAMGGLLTIAGLDGVRVLEVPPATPSGTWLCLAGAGMPTTDGRRGELWVRVVLRVPRVLRPEQIEVLRRLEEELASGEESES